MNTFYLEIDDLYALDASLSVDDPDELDREIEDIVSGLWRGTGTAEAILWPFFTTFLQSNLLRPLYIYYFSLREIQKRYPQVVIEASNSLLDIVATALGVELSAERSMHDEDFYLVRHYLFSKESSKRAGWKAQLRPWAWKLVKLAGWVRGTNVLYLNAGKLDEDFKQVKRKLSISLIPARKSSRLNWDQEAVSLQLVKNIRDMNLSIPTECVQKLLELRVLIYLPDLFDRIGTIVETIEALRVKLVITTAFTHEDHLCLLAAARIAGIESLVLTHGVTFAKNAFLDNYVNAQGTLSEVEPKYEGVRQFPMRYQWFDRRI